MTTAQAEKLKKIKAENPSAYSVEFAPRKPGELKDSPYAVVTYYGEEAGSAANREYIPLA